MNAADRKRAIFLFAAAALSLLFATGAWAEDETPEKPHAHAELVADVDAVAPGATLRLGARFTIDPEWHIYWINPGDAGIPTVAKFQVPDGFTIAETRYPAPEYFGAGTPLSGYGYEREVLLFATVTAPANLSGSEVKFTAETSWLVCRHTCIPGSQAVALTLPVKSDAAAGSNRALFDAAAAAVPVMPDEVPGLAVAGMLNTTGVAPDSEFEAVFTVKAPDGASLKSHPEINRPFFIPGPMNSYELTATTADASPTQGKAEVVVRVKGKAFPDEADSERIGGAFQFLMEAGGETKPVNAYFDIPLPRVPAGTAVSSVALPGSEGSETGGTTAAEPAPVAAPAAPASAGKIALMLLFAFIGGVILNIMPCVLPVISIKIFSLVRHADMSRSEMRRHGMAYTGGIVASFVALGLMVAVLKSGGEAVGWGFQFQSPLFVAGLASVVFAFGLSMLGVFEIMGVSGENLAKAENTTRRLLKADAEEEESGESVAGSFVNGVFATVLATPCTAPFLGAALGFAFTQPMPVIFITFALVGLGLAFPFLLLAFVPAWTRFLPRPGDWMNTFKALMGFLLMATVVWLLDVLGKQTGSAGLTRMLAYLTVLGVAAWLWGRWGSILREARVRRRAAVVAVALVIAGAGGLLRFQPAAAQGAGPVEEGGVTWEHFNEDRVKELVGTGKPVFIDFTAAWCWTCKVNESAVINTDTVRDALRANNVATFKGDWTNRDPKITEYLRRHGRAGVPMYVVIPPNKPEAPIVLPEVITKEMVVEAIQKAVSM